MFRCGRNHARYLYIVRYAGLRLDDRGRRVGVDRFPRGYEEVDYTQDGPERDRLLALNPLGQVPTLVLPNDEVMTESAAIILLLHDRAPHAELAPPGGSPLLPRFLRWLLFINAEIYPTFTYADHPQRWQPQAAGRNS